MSVKYVKQFKVEFVAGSDGWGVRVKFDHDCGATVEGDLYDGLWQCPGCFESVGLDREQVFDCVAVWSKDAHARYILMRHDIQARNHAYLYEYATVVGTVGEGLGAIDIVRIESTNPDYHATYQLGRLQSGMESRSMKVLRTLKEAEAEAERVSEYLTPRKQISGGEK